MLNNMSTIGEWIRGLQPVISEDAASAAITMRRVLFPGFNPQHGEGFLRFQGVNPIYRAGMPPESLSVVCWLGKNTDNAKIDDFPSHLGAGLTFVCDRRVEVLDELPMRLEGTDQHAFITVGEVADRRLVSPLKITDPAEKFKDLARKLASLGGGTEATIATAIHLHYGAVLLFDRDLAASYTLVVAAIETLSREFGDPPGDWMEWEKAEHWETFIKRHELSNTQGDALRAELMKDRQLRLKSTFVNYVIERLRDTFWLTSWEDYFYSVDVKAGSWREGSWQDPKEIRSFLPKDKELLARCLRKSYDARSMFVHSGKRVVNVLGQLRALSMPTSGEQPIAFAVLRSILTELIAVELKDRSTDYAIPDIVLKHSSP